MLSSGSINTVRSSGGVRIARHGVLVHACCPACVYASVLSLREITDEPLTLFFFVPSVTEAVDHEDRRQSLLRLAGSLEVAIKLPPPGTERYVERITPLLDPMSPQYDPEPRRQKVKERQRSLELILSELLEVAEREQFRAFSTSLFVSPYIPRAELVEACSLMSEWSGVDCLEFDGRKRYFLGKQRMRVNGYYMTDGCLGID